MLSLTLIADGALADTRVFSRLPIAIGRDPASDWPIDDPACALSRRHCVIDVRDGRIIVTDTSANGTFVGDRRRRLQPQTPTEIETEEAVHFGGFTLRVSTPRLDRTHPHRGAPPDPETMTAQSARGQRGGDAQPDAVLLEAFCEGAALDASLFIAEDPCAVMRRAGAMYRQTIDGIGALLAQRSALKRAYDMDRTAIAGAANNPLKWADPRRVAVDLLRAEDSPFLSGPDAVADAFADLVLHLDCLLAGARLAVVEALDELAPAQIEAATQAGMFQSRAEAYWRAFERRHAEVMAAQRSGGDKVVSRAFREGYERGAEGTGAADALDRTVVT